MSDLISDWMLCSDDDDDDDSDSKNDLNLDDVIFLS
jgi:hypothetical protein